MPQHTHMYKRHVYAYFQYANAYWESESQYYTSLIFCFHLFLSKMILYLSLLQGLQPYSSRGSASHISTWYQTLMAKTRELVNASGYGPLICLLPAGAANNILVQALPKRWWDTTHTFNIAKREIIVTPYDFHRMNCLRSNGPIINLKDKSGILLGIDLIGCAYPSEHICYFDLERNYKPLSQATPYDRSQMVRAFLLYVVRPYFFANGGQTVTLSKFQRWTGDMLTLPTSTQSWIH